MRRQCFADPPVSGRDTINGDRAWAPNIALVFTDGASNVNERQTIPQADLAKRNNIRIVAVGMTEEVDKEELDGIATDPSRNVFHVKDFNALDNILETFLSTVCDTTSARRESYFFIK